MGLTAKTALKAIFGLQMGIAAVLLGQDFMAVAPSLALPSRAPSVTQPVAPGDQTRRFQPGKITRPTRPGVEMPSTADMPARLQFEPEGEGQGIRIIGEIQAGDAQRFTEWLDRQAEVPARLSFHSPGGSVMDALEIGRRIRAEGIATAMSAEEVCLSACPYMLMAGVERQVDAAAKVGVHQHYYGESTVMPAFMAVEDIQRGQAEVIRYFTEMGIDLGLMEHSLATPPDEIYILLPEELRRFGVATEVLGEAASG